MPNCGSFATGALPAESEWETFYNLITHDDRNSYYIIARCNDESWKEIALKKQNINTLGFDSCSNYYVTHNGFTNTTRKTEHVRQLNSMFFDIDCHGQNNKTTRQAVNNAIAAINTATLNKVIPKPTMTVDTGRGLQLHYVLDKSIPFCKSNKSSQNVKQNKKTTPINFFIDVHNKLSAAIKSVIEKVPNMELDEATSDHSRVVRVPGTYNTKAKRYAKLLSLTNMFYTLKQLKESLATKTNSFKQHSNCKGLNGVKNNFHKGKNNTPLLASRLKKIKELQALRKYKCEGRRELMCFVFYNTAVQLYKTENAVKQLKTFNSNFEKPLNKTELKGCIKSISKVINYNGQCGYYLISAKKLIQLLDLTKQEIEQLNFFEDKRTIERALKKKDTKKKREKRNKLIIELYTKAKLTQKAIAEKIKCSLRTVASVISYSKHKEQKSKEREIQGEKQREQAEKVCKKMSNELGVCSSTRSLLLCTPAYIILLPSLLLPETLVSVHLVILLSLFAGFLFIFSFKLSYQCLHFP